jgi:ATP/maltotriose-dependent transcriptional regulator MalT
MSEGGLLATTNACLAQVVHALGRPDEAAQLCDAAAAAAPDDVLIGVLWRGVRAKLLAEQGEAAAAEALARQACAIAATTDLLWVHADAMLDLAEVLRLGDRAQEAAAAAQAGLALYAQKGHVVGATQARALLVDLTERL